MKKHFSIFTAFCCAAISLLSQTTVDDHAGEIMRIKGKWTKRPDNTMAGDIDFPASQAKLIFRQNESFAQILKQTYPDPTGLEASYYSVVGNWFINTKRPASYTFVSYYKSYYYNRHLNKILLADETSTSVRININSFGNLFEDQGEWLIDGKMTKVFAPLERDGEWKGLAVYKKEDWGPDGQHKRKFVLLTREGKLPYSPLTQKAYLLALKQKWEEMKKTNYEQSRKPEKDIPKQMEANRNNKSMTPEMVEKLNASLQKIYTQYMQNRDVDLQKLNSQFDNKIRIIDQYLSTHSEEDMRQPVVTSSLWNFPGFFGPEGKKRVYYPALIDSSYFNPNFPKHVPQMIMMEWDTEKDMPGMDFRRQFEEKFPVQKLSVMIDNGAVMPEIKESVAQKFDPENDPELKAIRIKAEHYADSLAKFKTNFTGMSTGFSQYGKTNIDTAFNIILPANNTKWLTGVSNKKLTAAELKNHVDSIDKRYTAILIGNGFKLPDVSSMKAGDACYSAVLLLLKGMGEEAAWLAIKAVEKAPDNIVVLNNAGAILNSCGFGPVAVPVLEAAIQKQAANSAIQNNLGQAYLFCGDIPKATSYLQKCVASDPYHPHANFSLACIYKTKGDKGSALKYVENSLRGSFSDAAWHLLYKLKPKARLMDYLKHRYKQPDYFNEAKYHLPPQCELASDIDLMRGEYKSYREMVEKAKYEFEAIEQTEYAAAIPSLQARVKNYKTSDIMRTPFTELGSAMMMDISLRIDDETEKLGRYQNIYKKEIGELSDAYNKARSSVHECDAKIALSNRYMEKMALVTREYQKSWMLFWTDILNDMAFWSTFAHPDKHAQRATFAGAVRVYLGELLRVAQTHFLDKCETDHEVKKEVEEYDLPKPYCPIDVDLSSPIGSFKLDCEKIEYHFGLLINADVTHSFRNHRTTIAIGAGLDGKFGGDKLSAGPISGEFSAKGKMQYFITFDGTHPSDQGIIWQASIKYSQKIKTGNEDIGDIGTTDLNLSANSTLSVHSGWSFDGNLYQYLDKIIDVKPEKQENKNVKIYTPNK